MAVEAAQEMKRRLRMLNGSLVEQGYPSLSHGIGIHTGEVVAANIGSPDRLSYTLIGDTVGDLQNDPKSDTLGQAGLGMRTDRCLDFRHKGKRKESGVRQF
jgi:hypothetical protein